MRGPSALHKEESMQATIPGPPPRGTCIGTDNDSALGGEPRALRGMVTEAQPVLREVSQSAMGYLHITVPTNSGGESSVHVCQMEAAKWECIGA